MLKSVNAGVVDRSPEIAAAAVTAGFAIARLALGIPSVPIPGRPDLGGAAPEPRFVCPRDMLKDIAAYSGIERKLSSELGAATRKLEPLHQAALIGGLSESEKKTAANLIAAIADLKRRIGEAVAPRNALRADLTLRQSHEIAPTASAQQEPIALALDSEPVRRWTTKFFDPPVKAGTTASNELADRFNLVAVWNVLARPVVDDGLCQRAGAGPQCGILSIDQDNEGRIEGLAYRDPIRAHLRVCQTAIAAMCSSGASKPLAQSVDAAPQLGRLMLLPLRNGFGEDTELTAEFAPDGRLLKAKYDSRKASGERALQVVGSSLNQGEAFVASRAKAQANAREAETADFDGRIRAAKQQRDLLDAEAALGADRIAQSRWLEDLEREIKQLEAEKKVRELREALKHGKHG